MIMPDHTLVELCGGAESDGDSTSITTENTTITTPDLVEAEEDSPLIQPGCLNPGGFPVKARSRSSASVMSAGSSVDTEFGNDSWMIQSIWHGAQRLFSLSGIKDQLRGGGVQDSNKSPEDDVIQTEPIQDERYANYPFRSQEGQTINNKGLLNSELKSKFERASNLTPEPMTSPRRGNEDGGDKVSHKRTATWHSESQFTHSPARKTTPTQPRTRLKPYISTPRMDAYLRVQPHPIRGLRPSGPRTKFFKHSDPQQLWCHKRAFDVYVHPSTLPEIYHYLQKRSTLGAFLVELTPVPQLNKYVQKTTEPAMRYDGTDSVDGEVRGKPDTGLPQSLVVRLCFATKVMVDQNGMTAYLSPGHPVEEFTGEKRVTVEVPVMVGQVLMSDLVRQQLEIKACSRVRIKHVQDSWKMSFVDEIKVVLHPLNYDKVSGPQSSQD